MCGIAGIFNLQPSKILINDKTIKKFNNDLKERGPDDSGTVILNNIGNGFSFTHRRLSIIDPKNGKQPYEWNKNYITFNGEIYNYKELNKKLINDKIEIKTNSDTETLLKYIVTYGIESINDIDGMFSFAIHLSNGQLILAKDHVGKKPLFYCFNKKKNRLYFSSSLKSLSEISSNELDGQDNKTEDLTVIIYNMLYGNLTFRDRTIYKNIKTINSGSYIIISPSKDISNKYIFKEKKYWKLEVGKKFYNLSFDDAKEKYSEIMDEAVKKRLISDVPLGTYLSGGLDSTIITHIAKKYKPDLNTYSICYDDDKSKENTFANLAAKNLKTNHHTISPDFSTYLQDMKRLISNKAAPLSTPNEVLINKLAKETSKKLKVVLSGEGADELFSGYGLIARAPIDFIRYAFRNGLAHKDKFDSSLLRAYGIKDFITFLSHFQLFYKRFSNFDILQLFNGSDYNLINSITEIDDFFGDRFHIYKKEHLYTQYAAIVFELNLKSLLERLDFNTMLGSIEARAPFLDKKIIDFAFNIPFSYKLKLKKNAIKKCYCEYNSGEFTNNFDITKHILREAYKNKIPTEIIERPKQSFPVPYENLYLDKNYSDDLKTRLLNNKNQLLNPNRAAIDEWYSNYVNGYSSFKQWSLDSLESFLALKK